MDAARYMQQTARIGQPRPGIPQNAGLVPPREVDENRDDVIPPHCPPVAPKGRVQHPAQMMYEEDNADLD